MNCKVEFKEISRYLDGACTRRGKEKIELHLEECQDCRQTIARLRLLKQALSELPPVKESQDFDAVFNQKLNERLETKVSVKLNEALEKALSGIRDVFMPTVPALARVTASLVLVIAVLFGGYNYYIYLHLPIIETVNGKAQVYRPRAQKWIVAEPNMRLRENDRIKTAQGSIVGIISKGKYAARIKGVSDMVIAKLDVRRFNHFTEFDINSGKLMVNTRKTFKGSNMLILTPACQAKVVGTAFAVEVDKATEGTTWLGVLEGKVKVTSQGKDVYVNAGQKTQVRPGVLPDIPSLLSDNEWTIIQELYQLGEKPQVVLLISMKEDRVRELLKPAPLYILDTTPRTIPKALEAIIYVINKAIEDGNIETHRFAIERLEGLIQAYPNPKCNPQFLMFVGSYYYYIGDYKKAIDTFERVVSEYPDYALSSLAQRAIAEIYQKNLNDQVRAEAAIKKLLQEYPGSVDAAGARDFFKNLVE